ncbi:MAG TPA: FAD-binding protein [Clostridia bacterium]|nr:FAD-binding protein [Clostridia bacterium]
MALWDEVKTDVLVVGSEAAGARAALEAADKGKRVLVITKSVAGKSAVTLKAVFSVSGAFGFADPRDNPDEHLKDTVIAGRMLNNQRLAEIVCREGPKRLDELGKWGVQWDKAPDGRYRQVKMYGHSYPRSLSVGFRVGLEWMRVLIKKIKEQPLITLMNDVFAIDYIKSEQGRVCGALVYDLKRGSILLIRAKAIIDATGGAMYLFKENSATPESTGDGLAMAFRAGAELVDMEFMQFYPIELYWPPSLKSDQSIPAFARTFLRAHLYNCDGERFMTRYAPNEMELADRDVLAKSIYREIRAGRGSEHGGVYLSATHLPRALVEYAVKRHAPGWKLRGIDLLEHGLDLRTEPLEVGPTAHFYCGGIRVDETWSSGIPGLYVAGEAAGGVNGANRLPGNALEETQVSGAIAGEQAAKFSETVDYGHIHESLAEEMVKSVIRLVGRNAGPRPIEVMDRLRETMWKDVGIIRDGQGLERAVNEIKRMQDEDLPNLTVRSGLIMNTDLREALELRNMLMVAEMMAKAALMRTETRGTHTRDDYPESSSSWLKNIVIQNKDGAPALYTVPVVVTKVPLEG